ncbi:MAG: hypothetical protein AB7O26_05800 [Planctomycetaceae bacterium]
MESMSPLVLSAIVGGIAGAAAVAIAFPKLRARMKARDEERAIRSFKIERERLEARFFDMASQRGKPRGLRWLECDWQNSVTFGRDLQSGLLTAFVGVNIRFEAIEGGDMEDVEAVSMIRDAAALFHYQQGHWGTGGRALFNMNPADALSRLGNQFEPVNRTTAPAPSH